MTNNHGKISIKGIIILISLFLGAIILLFFGVFISYTGNKGRIIRKTVNNTSNTLTDLIKKDERFYLDNNFNIESNIDSYVKYDETNEDIKKYTEFLNNILKIKTNIKITQDGDNSKLFYSINSKKNNDNYINIKYLVKDSTGYYYNDYITNKYINVGNNNYFETIKDDITTRENIKYLKENILESLSNNLSNNYSNQKRVKVDYNNNYVTAEKIEIELDNKKINTLYYDIINDLKNDPKTSSLLENYIKDFHNKKIKKKKYLTKNEIIKINIYTKGLTNSFIKLEIIHKKEKNENIISYEKINNNKGYLYISKNKNIKYKFEINKSDEKHYNINVYNKNNKNIGTITINKTEKEVVIDVSINDDNKRLDIDYKVNYKNLKKKEYKEDIRLDIKYLTNNINVLTLSSEIDKTITTNIKIKEDTTDSILEKKLSEEQKTKKDQFIEKTIKEILGGLYETKK